MSDNTIQEKFKLYLEMQKELTAFRKKQAEQKKITHFMRRLRA